MSRWKTRQRQADRWQILSSQSQEGLTAAGESLRSTTTTTTTLAKCGICHVEAGRYTCPQCHLVYGSLQCYRDSSHRLCVEAHAKKNVEEAIKAGLGGVDGKRMMQMLRDFEQSQVQEVQGAQSDDDDDDDDQADLLHVWDGLEHGADPEILLGQMSMRNRNKFFELLQDPRAVQDLLDEPDFVPWWESESGQDPEKIETNMQLPRLPNQVQETVIYNIVHLILVYALVVRRFRVPVGESSLADGHGELVQLFESSLAPSARPTSMADTLHLFQSLLGEAAMAEKDILVQCIMDATLVLQPSIVQAEIGTPLGLCHSIHGNCIRALDHASSILAKAAFDKERRLAQLKLAFYAAFLIHNVTRSEMQTIIDELGRAQRD